MNAAELARRVIDWHAHGGRHDLPWQHDRTPYRVWISEIMLQQTQVSTVIPYYERFMQRFPHVRALADAPIDDVLHLWAGLGYYARGRNLHRAAQKICTDHGGEFPLDFEAVAALPGIGRSTAGAILTLGAGQRHPILDGNVKRVLSRVFAVEGSPSERVVEQRLWGLADSCTPQQHADVYTQAIMDLGATVCVRRRPLCEACPLEGICAARATGRQHELPAPKKRLARGSRTAVMLLALRDDGAVLLEKRPDRGIWGGLWCLPQFDTESAAHSFAAQRLAEPAFAPHALPLVHHAFTHFDLEITPLACQCSGLAGVMDDPGTLWYKPGDTTRVGLPAPVSELLEALSARTLFE
jgi:A/G-specific adenine glycosylase